MLVGLAALGKFSTSLSKLFCLNKEDLRIWALLLFFLYQWIRQNTEKRADSAYYYYFFFMGPKIQRKKKRINLAYDRVYFPFIMGFKRIILGIIIWSIEHSIWAWKLDPSNWVLIYCCMMFMRDNFCTLFRLECYVGPRMVSFFSYSTSSSTLME